MGKNPRCLFEDKIESFLNKEKESTFGILCEGYHGDALTTTREEILFLNMIFHDWGKE